MAATVQTLNDRALKLSYFTVAYNVLEGVVVKHA